MYELVEIVFDLSLTRTVWHLLPGINMRMNLSHNLHNLKWSQVISFSRNDIIDRPKAINEGLTLDIKCSTGAREAAMITAHLQMHPIHKHLCRLWNITTSTLSPSVKSWNCMSNLLHVKSTFTPIKSAMFDLFYTDISVTFRNSDHSMSTNHHQQSWFSISRTH